MQFFIRFVTMIVFVCNINFATFAAAQNNFETSRLLDLEEEVRTLIGKVEMLEHKLATIAGKAVNTATNSGNTNANGFDADIAKMAEHTSEPTLPLGASQGPTTQGENPISSPTEAEAQLAPQITTAPAPTSTSLANQYEEAESNQFLANQQAQTMAPAATQEIEKPQVKTNPAPVPPKKVSNKGERQTYELALARFKDKQYPQAQKQLNDFIDLFPQSKLVSNAYFWLGETYYRQNYNENAAVQYLKSYKVMPTGGKAADALLMLSFALNNIGKQQEACSMLVRLEQEFPKRPISSIKKAKDAKLKFGCN